ncbi:hypothetical protein LASUN_06690 [Lentilactobacillus sunkii]|jgi:high-affinity Fe2+/Pb2+ permease|uniref:Lipoprotein n=1 Tax=Lentilactobacillus sunkii TaxID=481719 RepID=A0A1E7XG97_9LACO|nr:hypothetical protein [Lentilactobacillus sunkii]OFA12117.1 hypothetical protein LASUN_06690 [Lentilactobacillus sunkii]
MRTVIGIAGLLAMASCVGAIIFLLLDKMNIAVPLLVAGTIVLIVTKVASSVVFRREQRK